MNSVIYNNNSLIVNHYCIYSFILFFKIIFTINTIMIKVFLIFIGLGLLKNIKIYFYDKILLF